MKYLDCFGAAAQLLAMTRILSLRQDECPSLKECSRSKSGLRPSMAHQRSAGRQESPAGAKQSPETHVYLLGYEIEPMMPIAALTCAVLSGGVGGMKYLDCFGAAAQLLAMTRILSLRQDECPSLKECSSSMAHQRSAGRQESPAGAKQSSETHVYLLGYEIEPMMPIAALTCAVLSGGVGERISLSCGRGTKRRRMKASLAPTRNNRLNYLILKFGHERQFILKSML
jgi:hypothetical protein